MVKSCKTDSPELEGVKDVGIELLGEVLERESQETGICLTDMIAYIKTEVIPCWYVEKWLKENSEPGSALEHYVRQMVKDWKIEEIRMKNED